MSRAVWSQQVQELPRVARRARPRAAAGSARWGCRSAPRTAAMPPSPIGADRGHVVSRALARWSSIHTRRSNGKASGSATGAGRFTTRPWYSPRVTLSRFTPSNGSTTTPGLRASCSRSRGRSARGCSTTITSLGSTTGRAGRRAGAQGEYGAFVLDKRRVRAEHALHVDVRVVQQHPRMPADERADDAQDRALAQVVSAGL